MLLILLKPYSSNFAIKCQRGRQSKAFDKFVNNSPTISLPDLDILRMCVRNVLKIKHFTICCP